MFPMVLVTIFMISLIGAFLFELDGIYIGGSQMRRDDDVYVVYSLYRNENIAESHCRKVQLASGPAGVDRGVDNLFIKFSGRVVIFQLFVGCEGDDILIVCFLNDYRARFQSSGCLLIFRISVYVEFSSQYFHFQMVGLAMNGCCLSFFTSKLASPIRYTERISPVNFCG